MKVNKVYLLLVSSAAWLIAGFNVCRIGLLSYVNYVSLLNIALSVVVFLVFWFMIFARLVKKHEIRIMGYSEKENILKFFDKKSYIIMFFMMSLGIILRRFVPVLFVAVFYSGLGWALFLSGVKLFIAFIKHRN